MSVAIPREYSQAPEFISRNGNSMGRFADFALNIHHELACDAVLDGELVCLDRDGRPHFYDAMFGRRDYQFVAFDVLLVDGRDVRGSALVERKKILRTIIPRRSSRILFADSIDARGVDFFQIVCDRDLEGIVAKWKRAPYAPTMSPLPTIA